jgi:hypothetical protein
MRTTAQLATAAADQAMEEFETKHSLADLGVQETSRTIIDIHANGYRIRTPKKQSAQQLSVTHVSTLIRDEIVQSIQEMQSKLLPSATVNLTSFMLAYYYTMDAIEPAGSNYCLVDITNEATELGIVRHNSLQYCTHVAYGRASLAREIATATNLPLHDAFTSLRTIQQKPDINTDVEKALTEYQNQITNLFKETGDRLTIPKHIYLLADAGLGDFFTPIIESAGKSASKGSVLVTVITPDMFITNNNHSKQTDTPVAIASNFFHTKSNRTFFEYL